MMELIEKRCAIYTRKSVEEGLEQEFNSLDAQRNLCESYIKSQKHNGWIIIEKHYDDGGFSGGNMNRPGLQMLFSDIKSGQVDIVVTYKIDRLSRSLLDFSKINDFFEGAHVGFVSVTQDINTNTSSGRMLWNILMTFAQFERETISERVRDKIAASKRLGKFCTGMTPMGYCKDPMTRRLVIESSEGRVVKQIFARYLKLRSCGLVARELNEKGIRTREWISRHNIAHGGKMWSVARIHSILNNPIYLGLIPHHNQLYTGEHEALISQETWDSVHEILRQNNGRREKQHRHRHSAVLSSLIRCGECKSAMTTTYTEKHRKRYFYYCCLQTMKYPDMKCPNHKLPVREVEMVVLFQLEILFRCYSMQQMICEESELLRKKLLRDMTKERSGLRAYILNCKDELSCREAQEKVKRLSRRIGCIQTEIRQRSIQEEMNHFQVFWNGLTPDAKTDLLDSIIERVEVFPDRVWTYLKQEYVKLERELSAQLRIAGSQSHIRREGDNLIFATPTSIKTCSGHTHVEIVGVNYDSNRHCLLRMIALSWKWAEMLFSGKVTSISRLAKEVGLSEPYVARIVSLFNLAPCIVEDIVNGRIPDGLSLAQMQNLPDDWQEQCRLLGFSFRPTGI